MQQADQEQFYFEEAVDMDIHLDEPYTKANPLAMANIVANLQKLLKVQPLQSTSLSFIRPYGDPTKASTQVFLAYDNTTNCLVIVKHITHPKPWLIPISALKEIETHAHFLHTFRVNYPRDIQKLHNLEITKTGTKIISPFYPISFRILFDVFYSRSFVEKKAFQLIRAVKLLHESNVFHRDIKGSNICFREDGSLVIIDFDSSCPSGEAISLPICTLNKRAPEVIEAELIFIQQEKREQQQQQDEEKKDSQKKKQEEDNKQEEEKYNAEALDWWSVGCVLWEMYIGRSPILLSESDDLTQCLQKVHAFLETLHNNREDVNNILLLNRAGVYMFEIITGFLCIDIQKRIQTARNCDSQL